MPLAIFALTIAAYAMWTWLAVFLAASLRMSGVADAHGLAELTSFAAINKAA